MNTDLDTMMERLPDERRKRVEARAGELIAEEATLRGLEAGPRRMNLVDERERD